GSGDRGRRGALSPSSGPTLKSGRAKRATSVPSPRPPHTYAVSCDPECVYRQPGGDDRQVDGGFRPPRSARLAVGPRGRVSTRREVVAQERLSRRPTDQPYSGGSELRGSDRRGQRASAVR